MSKQAESNFHSITARKRAFMEHELTTLIRGRAKDRVSGAGKHLRYIPEKTLQAQRLKMSLRDLNQSAKAMGLPDNFSTYIADSCSALDVARIEGWFLACQKRPAAMALLNCVYAMGSGRGAGSSYHKCPADPVWLMRLWISPGCITHNHVRGLRFVAKFFAHLIPKVRNAKFFENLGKISSLARWVLVGAIHEEKAKEGRKTRRRTEESQKEQLTHRSLNWQLLVGMNQKQMLEFVPEHMRERVQWGLSGLPFCKTASEAGLQPSDFKVAVLKRLLPLVDRKKPEMVDALLRLVLIFKGDQAALMRHVGKYGQGERALHDAAQMLPMRHLHRDWKQFVAVYAGHELFSAILQNHQQVEVVCNGVPRSIMDMRERYAKAGKAFTMDLFHHEAMFVEEHAAKSFEACPHIEVRKGDYVLRKLDAYDTKQVTAGRLVDCCQKLGGAGSSCAALAWTSGYCAIYAVFKGSTMVAQTFAWRAKDGSMVFDSIESLGMADKPGIAPMFIELAERAWGQLGITRVMVGQTHYGMTGHVIALLENQLVPTPETAGFHLGYSDARSGCYVITKGAVTNSEKLASAEMIAMMPTEVPVEHAINALMPGSDVYCEHCDAEVHPACEICPACGANIAEWV